MTEGKSQVLIVDDEEAICNLVSHLMEREGLVPLVARDGKTALQKLRMASPDTMIVDLKLPDADGLEILRQAKELDADLPVVISTAHAKVHGAVEAMRAAAFDYLVKPYDHEELMRVVHRALAQRQLSLQRKQQARQTSASHNLTEIMGPSDAIGRLIGDLNRVAQSNFSVVIIGETGSGKEVVAQAIHASGARAQCPFVPVDSGAIPETLFEAELFGHEKGAFTGAAGRKAGRFEQANGGTLFLDEILNMPLIVQAKVLRALQEKSFCRVGGAQPIKIDVRVLALLNYTWPGNVRQLRSTIRRAVLLAGEMVTEEHLDILPANSEAWRRAASAAPAQRAFPGALSLREIVAQSTGVLEREALSQALRQTGGNKAGAARLLRVDYKTIQSKIKRYGISSQEEKS
jgi:two-component system nitrogen regulation response regulator GlnG